MAHSHHMHREHQVSHRRVDHILKHEPAGAKEHSHRHAFSKVTSKTAAEHHGSKVSGDSAPKRFARGGRVKKAEGGATPPVKLPTPEQLVATTRSRPQSSDQDAQDAMKSIEEKMGKARGGRTFARGGKVKGHKNQTNIIVVPHHQAAPPAGPMAGPAGPPPPGAGLPPGPMGAPPGGPGGGPPGMPPGMPPPGMRARGGKVIDGEATKGNISKWSKRASDNSYKRGGGLPTAGAATGVGRLQESNLVKRKGKK
jgi:hypothetical protein